MANPDAAIELLAKQEPLINKDIEKRRLVYVAQDIDRHAGSAPSWASATSGMRA